MSKRKICNILNNTGLFLAVILCPAFAIFFANFVIRGGFFVNIDYLLNKLPLARIAYIPILLITIIITLIFRKVSVAYIVTGGLSIIAGSAYYFKMFYRGDVLRPSDIVFASAAGSMMEEFNITLTSEMKEALFALVLVTVATHFFTMPKINNKYILNVSAAVFVSLLLVLDAKMCLFNLDFYKDKDTFGFMMSPAEVYYRNTFHTAFIYYTNVMVATPPDNYTEEHTKALLADYRSDNDAAVQQTPDIIFLLAESYFQPDEVFGLQFSEYISENYKKIASQGVYGNTVALKYGGGTGEIEFSSLNQINIGLFVDGISYMNSFGDKYLPSFIHRLKDAGYETHAMHAHTDALYNRRNAYKNMGIDNVMFSDSYEYADRIGSFIDDSSNVQQIIDKYEQFLADPQGENIFIACASMQNHMPMTEEVMAENAVTLLDEGYSDTFAKGMSVVAAYQNMTDEAIGMLYDYFSTVDREVVIILYGDHQSYTVTEYEDFSVSTLKEIPSYSQLDKKEQFVKTHTTPFVIWSNKRDMGGVNYPFISIHNLYSIASHRYNLPHGSYEEYVYSLAMEYPVVDYWNNIVLDKDGNLTEVDGKTKDEIYLINYDMLYGERYALQD